MNICPYCGTRETLLRGVEWHTEKSEKWNKPEQGFLAECSCYGCNRDFVVTVWQDGNRVRTEV